MVSSFKAQNTDIRFHNFSHKKLNIDFDSLKIGMDDPNRPFMPLDKALRDEKRIRFHRDYLSNLSAAIR